MPRQKCDSTNGYKISLSDFERKQIRQLQTAQVRKAQLDNYTKLGVAALGTAGVGMLGYSLFKGMQYLSAGVAAINSTYEKFEDKIQEIGADTVGFLEGTTPVLNPDTGKYEQVNGVTMYNSVGGEGWEYMGENKDGEPFYQKVHTNRLAGVPVIGGVTTAVLKLFSVGTSIGTTFNPFK